MEERSNHLIVVVGASCVADRLRRQCLRLGQPTVGITNRFSGLREVLIRGEFDHVIICVCFDHSTIQRHSRNVNRLIDDRAGFRSTLSVVGLLHQDNWSRGVAETGCDFLVHSMPEAFRWMKRLSVGRVIRPRHKSQSVHPVGCEDRNRIFGSAVSDELKGVLETMTTFGPCLNAVHETSD